MLKETAALVVLRAAIFFSCRKYILSSVYANLQQESLPSNDYIPLQEPLPSPITQSERDKPLRKTKTEAGDVFAGCFMESCMLCVLLMMQALDVFSPRARLLNWRVSLFILLTLVLVCIPFLLSLLLTLSADSDARPRTTVPRLAFSTFSVGIYLLLLSLTPLPAPAPDYTTAALSRLIVLGTAILGLLAGFGAASSVWMYFPLGETLTPPTEHELVSAQESLSAIRDDMERKREEGRRRAEEAAASQTGGTWLSRVMPSFRGDEDTQVLAGLSALEHQMTLRVDALRQRRLAAMYARTWYGRFSTLCGRFFALYCAFRIISTTMTFFLPSLFLSTPTNSSGTTAIKSSLDIDLATRILTTLLPPLADNPHLATRLARHGSLLLAGVIILLSMRRVVRGVTRALRVTSRSLGAAMMVLVLAWVMSVYLLATIVQLRASFPPPSTPTPDAGDPDTDAEAATTNLFSTIPPFAIFGSLFDGAFLFAAGGAIVGRWVGSKVGASHE
ncbi:G protein-coupled receptor 89 [Mycena amicta]|nr:G protein-coupled receptor 89 [Mycena amicta]